MNVTVVGGMGRLGSAIAAHVSRFYPMRVADIKPGGEPTEEATKDADVVLVIVDTPSLPSGAYAIGNVLDACGQIDLSRWRLVVISSTVNPGDTEGVVRKALEKSGKTAHRDFGLACVPEFVRQGTVEHDFANPWLLIAGCETQLEQAALRELYGKLCHKEVTFMSIASAEIAKIGLNTVVTAKLSKANEIAWLCQYTPGADARDVLDALKKDPRISPLYFGAGPPPGGPCFPRDDAAFSAALDKAGIEPVIADAARRWWMDQFDLMADMATKDGGKVGVAGLSFKPGHSDPTESPGLRLAEMLGADTYDPDLPSSCETFAELASKCDVIVLAMPFDGIEAILDFALKPHQRVIDWWGVFGDEFERFGKGPEC